MSERLEFGMARKDSTDKADKPRRSRRQIALTVIFKQFGARFAEKSVRLLPQDWMEMILRYVPQGTVAALLDDDNQDAVASVASAVLEAFGLSEDASIVAETIIKETIEETGLRIEELGGGDADFEKIFEHALAKRLDKEQDKMHVVKKEEKKSPRLSFTQRLADPTIDPAHRARFVDWLDNEPDDLKSRYLAQMGESVAELDEVKFILGLDDVNQRVSMLNDLLRRASKLGDKPKSLLEGAAERFGLGGVTHNIGASYQSVVDKIKDVGAKAKDMAAKRRFGGY